MSLDNERFMYLLEKAFVHPTELKMFTNSSDYAQMTDIQEYAILSAVAVAHVGGTSEPLDGLMRIWEKFPGNFDKSGRPVGAGGKQTRGAMTEEEWHFRNMLYNTAQHEVKYGMSIKKACSQAGIDPKDYREWLKLRVWKDVRKQVNSGMSTEQAQGEVCKRKTVELKLYQAWLEKLNDVHKKVKAGMSITEACKKPKFSASSYRSTLGG